MFCGCSKLKEINVTNFKTKNCRYINKMFRGCKSLESIDMLNWDMNKIGMYDIGGLFGNCSSLKSIKMNFDSEKKVYNENKNEYIKICFKNYIFDILNIFQSKALNIPSGTFEGLPGNGIFIWKKGVNCNELLKQLPVSWNRSQE